MGVRKLVNGEAGEYEFESYERVGQRVHNLAAGLASFKLGVKANIGLYSVNRPEWILGEQACYANNFVTVPLYDTLGDEALEYICQQTEMQVLVIDIRKVPMILKLKEKLPKLKRLVIMDDEPEKDLLDLARSKGLDVHLMSELEDLGAENKAFKHDVPTPEDLCTICYTSGTTGMPKGVIITHEGLLAAVASASYYLGLNDLAHNPAPIANLERGVEAYLSFLPLAHIMERVVFSLLSSIGTRIGFYQGDVLKLLSDVETLKPTIFVAVPRLFNRIHDKVLAGVELKGGVAKWLFNHALEVKIANYRKSGALTHWLWDRIVFGAVRAKLGGQVKVMLTGSAPLSPQVHDFVRVVFGAELIEGYGMTETCALSALTVKGDVTHGTVGGPAPSVEIKLVDIPDMEYLSTDKPNARGEVWIRGPTSFTGYYNNAEATKGALQDGWVATGDVGMFDAQGRLFIIDRKKSLFKLSQGEYISPEKIEAVLARSPLIAQAYVEGNSLKSTLVAVVIPDAETVLPWAKSHGLSSEMPELCKNGKLREAIMEEIKKLGNHGSGELKGFEMPKAVHLDSELFTPENGLVTPTFKLKRPQAKKKYGEIVTELYKGLPE